MLNIKYQNNPFSKKNRISKSEFQHYIKYLITKHGSLEKLGEELGFQKSTISDVARGRRDPSERFLAQLGLRKIILFEKDPATETQ